MQKVYIELVFLDNFFINWLVVFAAAALGNAEKKIFRFAAASAIGGVYACAALGMGGVLWSLLIKIAVSMIMCLVAYFAKGQRGFLRCVIAFYAVSFVFAGAIYAVSFSAAGAAAIGGAIGVRPPVRYILFGLSAGSLLVWLLTRVYRRVRDSAQQSIVISLIYSGKCMDVRAYVDTGNLAVDPLGGSKVIFVSEAVAKALFDAKTLQALHGQGDTLTDRLRLIPCATAAGQSIFFGIEMEQVRMHGAQTSKRAVVCIARTPISEGCGAIIGSSLADELKKGAKNEATGNTEDHRVGVGEAAPRKKHRLYQRKRSAASAAQQAGGGRSARTAGTWGYDSASAADREKPPTGGVHRTQV